jgi:hypothetical protein
MAIKKGLLFRPGQAQNGTTDEKHGFSQCYHRLKKVRDADSYACDPAIKYLIQEKNWNCISIL